MKIEMTRETALSLQKKQLDYYVAQKAGREWLYAYFAERTTADNLEPGKKYDVVEINRNIPRGGQIERAIMEKEG